MRFLYFALAINRFIPTQFKCTCNAMQCNAMHISLTLCVFIKISYCEGHTQMLCTFFFSNLYGLVDDKSGV